MTQTDAGDGIAQFIRDNLSKQVTLGELCKKTNYSKSYFIKIFKNKFGKNPVAYLEEMRFKNAGYMLISSSLSIFRVASDLGINKYNFYKAIRQQFKTSLEKFRESRRG